MKKILCAALLVIFTGTACAETVGALSRLNMSSKEFQAFMIDRYSKRIQSAIRAKQEQDISCVYYVSMSAMLMALNSGRIDTMLVPEYVADYVLKEASGTESRGFITEKGLTGLTMGFRADDTDLRDKVNAALTEMSKAGTLSILLRHNIYGAGAENPQPAKFDRFKGAKTLNVAITGDLPPIDYVDAGGDAAGFNTALLSELGRKLKMNINLIHIEAGARASALISGRADCVFWFALYPGKGAQWDIPSGIIVTAPYFNWNKNYFIGLKK